MIQKVTGLTSNIRKVFKSMIIQLDIRIFRFANADISISADIEGDICRY